MTVGEPAPFFRAPGTTNPNYAFDSAAGRYLLLAILSGLDDDAIRAALAEAQRHRAKFDDSKICYFALLPDTPEWRGAVQDDLPGVRHLFDDGSVRRLYIEDDREQWVLVDPSMRILAHAQGQGRGRLLADLDRLPAPGLHAGVATPAPVLVVPRVFEPEFCKVLIDHYQAQGGEESGFMREIDGQTRLVKDYTHKRRSDVIIEDGPLQKQAVARLNRRLSPQLEKAFCYTPTRIERYLVACYDAGVGGYFRPHRDNTTKGTAHRRFAVSINLNADFEGGDLRFPEYGPQTYRPPPGGAVVFNCSLLHEATPVTRGLRFAFLPFLYDEAAAKVREENQQFIQNDLRMPGFRDEDQKAQEPVI